MHITKPFPKKFQMDLNRSTFFQVSLLCFASAISSLSYANSDDPNADHSNMNQHLKEHGGQIYQVSNLETAWLLDEDGQGALSTELNSMIGTDENRLFILAHVNKAESSEAHYDVAALYSRKISDFWDAQAGLRVGDRGLRHARIRRCSCGGGVGDRHGFDWRGLGRQQAQRDAALVRDRRDRWNGRRTQPPPGGDAEVERDQDDDEGTGEHGRRF